MLDGELAIPIGKELSFDALQLRLNPAESRIRKLAAETPGVFICFDLLLAPNNRSMIDDALREWRAKLEQLFARWRDAAGVYLSPCTHSLKTARKWLDRAGGALDGVCAAALMANFICHRTNSTAIFSTINVSLTSFCHG